MKVYQKFQGILLVAAFIGMTACKQKQKDNPDQKESPEMEMNTDSERQAMPEDAAGVGPAAQTGGSTGASNNLKMGVDNDQAEAVVTWEKMYTELEMTDDQIQEFKTALGNENPDLQLQNASGAVPRNLYETIEGKLESILNDEQLQKYREWKAKQ